MNAPAPNPYDFSIQISDPQAGRELLRLRIVNGQLTADFDPADLDDAAQRFVDEVVQRNGDHVSVWATHEDVTIITRADEARERLLSLDAEPYPPMMKAALRSFSAMLLYLVEIGACPACLSRAEADYAEARQNADENHHALTGQERCEGCRLWLDEGEGHVDNEGVRLCDVCWAALGSEPGRLSDGEFYAEHHVDDCSCRVGQPDPRCVEYRSTLAQTSR